MKNNEKKAFDMLVKDSLGEFDTDVINYSYEKYMRGLVKNNMMPKRMSPGKKYWEKLGFAFEEVGDDILYKASLPEGWHLEPTDDLMWVEIVDNNDLKRGFCYYKINPHKRRASMSLECRYDVYSEFIDDKNTVKEVYFGNPEEKLFVAGQVDYSEQDRRDLVATNYHYEEQLKSLARNYARAYYPNWQDINAYWDEEKKVRKIKR